MAGDADEGQEQGARGRTDHHGDQGGAQVHPEAVGGHHEGAGRQHKDADGQVAPQHPDVECPEPAEGGGDGLDAE